MIPAAYRGVNLHPMWCVDSLIDQICVQILPASRAQAVRIDFPLSALLHAPATFQANFLERLTRFVKACPPSVEILGNLSYTPPWANGGQAQNIPWANVADWTAGVTQVVQAFPTVAAWEIWNEPDLDYAWAHSTGTVMQRSAAYVQLLKAAYPAIKAASPNAKVVAAAVSAAFTAPTWLAGFYAADPHGYYDVMSGHIYGPDPVDAVQTFAASIWPLLATNGDGLTPLWITEAGWNTAPVGASTPTVDQQAAALTGVYQEVDRQLPPASRLYWFQLNDNRSGTTSPGDYYGLLDVNGAQKGDGSAFAAFQALP